MNFYSSYNIRREKGLLRDPKTGGVGPNRKQIRYTEMADEMVEKLGRVGQKAKKVSPKPKQSESKPKTQKVEK